MGGVGAETATWSACETTMPAQRWFNAATLAFRLRVSWFRRSASWFTAASSSWGHLTRFAIFWLTTVLNASRSAVDVKKRFGMIWYMLSDM